MTIPSSFDEMIESDYMKKEDVTPDKLLTIAGFTRENVAMQGQPAEYKWAMSWHEQGFKPMLLNSTNIQLLKSCLGVATPQESVGRQIVAYNDPNVAYMGKLVGGVRLRAPRTKTAPPAPVAPPVAHVDKFDDDIPF